MPLKGPSRPGGGRGKGSAATRPSAGRSKAVPGVQVAVVQSPPAVGGSPLTELHDAVTSGSVARVELLLAEGSKVNGRNAVH